jgi:hypothetical protein
VVARGFMGKGVKKILKSDYVCMIADEGDAELVKLLTKRYHDFFIQGYGVYLGITPNMEFLADGYFHSDSGPGAIQAINNAAKAKEQKPNAIREWTSKDGGKTVEAKFVEFDGRTLEVETAEGKRIKIASENLSDESIDLAVVLSPLLQKYIDALKNKEIEATKSGNLDLALAAREERLGRLRAIEVFIEEQRQDSEIPKEVIDNNKPQLTAHFWIVKTNPSPSDLEPEIYLGRFREADGKLVFHLLHGQLSVAMAQENPYQSWDVKLLDPTRFRLTGGNDKETIECRWVKDNIIYCDREEGDTKYGDFTLTRREPSEPDKDSTPGL